MAFSESDAAPLLARDLRRQATIARAFEKEGTGLHTGHHSRLTVRPAGPGHGIVFRRLDLPGSAPVPALWSARSPQPLCTAVGGPDGTLVRTVEHLLSALAAHAVDNALVELEGEEVPILDGSALPWVTTLRAVGITEQGAPRRAIRILEPFSYRHCHHEVRGRPATGLQTQLDVYSRFKGWGEMEWHGAIDAETYRDEIAPARSMGHVQWALPLMIAAPFMRKPILRGAGLRNTAPVLFNHVIGGERVKPEYMRHRVLDLIGDLSLAGAPILGALEVRYPTHDFTGGFVAWLMRNDHLWKHDILH